MDHDPSPGDDAATLRARLAHAIANLPEALRACAPDALANRVAPIFAEDDHERCAARARRAPAPQHHRSITTAPSSYTPRGEDPKKSATTIHPSRPLAAAHAAAPPSRRLNSPPKKTPHRTRPPQARARTPRALPPLVARTRLGRRARRADVGVGSIRRGGAPRRRRRRARIRHRRRRRPDAVAREEKKIIDGRRRSARVLRRSFEPSPRGRRRGARGVRGVRSSPRDGGGGGARVRRRRRDARAEDGRRSGEGQAPPLSAVGELPREGVVPDAPSGWGRGSAARRRRRREDVFHLLCVDVDVRGGGRETPETVRSVRVERLGRRRARASPRPFTRARFERLGRRRARARGGQGAGEGAVRGGGAESRGGASGESGGGARGGARGGAAAGDPSPPEGDVRGDDGGGGRGRGVRARSAFGWRVRGSAARENATTLF